MLINKCNKRFANGIVYLLETEDGFPLETTDTFLPSYTKDAIGKHQNALTDSSLGSRYERWMVGVSTMSGCPVKCKFCATGKMKRYRKLSAEEIVGQVDFILSNNPDYDPVNCREFKINYTRMGEPFLNVDNVREAIRIIDERFPGQVHHYVSTVGIEGSDFSWIKDNITLQFSIHSFDEEYRDWLIPIRRKLRLSDMGKVRTESNLKTTLNLTLVRQEDFDVGELKKFFDPEFFFVKLSPINPNDVSDENNISNGVIEQSNLV